VNRVTAKASWHAKESAARSAQGGTGAENLAFSTRSALLLQKRRARFGKRRSLHHSVGPVSENGVCFIDCGDGRTMGEEECDDRNDVQWYG